jgi:hypothetical protein
MRDLTGQSGSRRWAVIAVLAAMLVSVASGCGEATIPSKAEIKAKAKSSVIVAAKKATPARSQVVARIDATSDAIIAEGKVHIASGAPSDAEIRREIKAARKAGIVLPTGDTAQSFENAPSNSGHVLDVETPEAVWNPQSKPIADWIIPVLQWAYGHGWTGAVTSGYRNYYEQAQLNAAGAYSAPAGLSNHETTVYPGGAVDVTDPSQLIAVLRSYPGPMKLIGGVLGPVDPEHFSATGD